MRAKKTAREAASGITGASTRPAPTREQVQELAHAIWTDRGCPQGCDVEIWLEAERQLREPMRLDAGAGPTDAEASLDPDRSDAARVEREMDRIVSPSEQRSATSL